jgi:hypothetical protein
MRLNSVHAIIMFYEMQNGTIWGHFRVSYNIESRPILMTDRQQYLKIVKNVPFVSWQIRTLPLLLYTSPLQNLGEYASIPEKIVCHSSYPN